MSGAGSFNCPSTSAAQDKRRYDRPFDKLRTSGGMPELGVLKDTCPRREGRPLDASLGYNRWADANQRPALTGLAQEELTYA